MAFENVLPYLFSSAETFKRNLRNLVRTGEAPPGPAYNLTGQQASSLEPPRLSPNDLLGNFIPGGGAGIITKADKKFVMERLMALRKAGKIDDAKFKEGIDVINSPSKWNEKFFNFEDRNYFYGPDRLFRKEIPDYVDKDTMINVTGARIDHPLAPKDLFDGVNVYQWSSGNSFSRPTTYSKAEINLESPMKKHISLLKAVQEGSAEDVQRIIDINAKRSEIEKKVRAGYLAHEAQHAAQWKTGLPGGTNKEHQLKNLVANASPEDQKKWQIGAKVFDDLFASDPIYAVVMASQSKNPQATAKELTKFISYEDVLEPSKSIFGGMDTVGQRAKVDTEGLRNYLYRLWKMGDLNLEKMPEIEGMFKASNEATNRYKTRLGEAEARAVQKRLWRAMTEDSTDVYKTHPYSNLDVKPEDLWWGDSFESTIK